MQLPGERLVSQNASWQAWLYGFHKKTTSYTAFNADEEASAKVVDSLPWRLLLL
jgi:hypothetical protein